jgi:hypothetical protein
LLEFFTRVLAHQDLVEMKLLAKFGETGTAQQFFEHVELLPPGVAYRQAERQGDTPGKFDFN